MGVRPESSPLARTVEAPGPRGKPLSERVHRIVTCGRRGVAWFMPRPAPLEERDRLRAELVLSFDLGFASIGLLVLIAIHFVFPIPEESRALALQTVPMLVAGLAVSALCLRFTGRVRLAAQITIATAFGVMVASTALHGGTTSPVLSIWPMVPIVAGLLAGRRASLGWAGAVVAFMTGLFWAETSGVFTPTPIADATYMPSLLVNMAVACGSAAAAVALYETINANLRRSLAAERAQYAWEAGHDPLTNLPNRRLFAELQEKALRRADRTKQKVGLFVIDLDEFKPINDRCGHAAGDRLLEIVASRLSAFTRATDSLARLGGDEFAVLVELLDSVESARVLAGRLHGVLSADAELARGQSIPVRASIGIALYPDHAATAAELDEAADTAMYAAKSAGGNRFCLPEANPDSDPL